MTPQVTPPATPAAMAEAWRETIRTGSTSGHQTALFALVFDVLRRLAVHHPRSVREAVASLDAETKKELGPLLAFLADAEK